MKRHSLYLDTNFWIVITILIVTVAAIISTYFHVYPTEMLLGPLPVHHWASILGVSAIALFNPVYSILKRKYPTAYKSLFKIHAYFNLIAFLPISTHFAHHLIEEINPVIDTGTGFLQYFVLTLLIITGIMRRFQIASKQRKAWQYLHEGLALTLFFMVIGHILRAFRIL